MMPQRDVHLIPRHKRAYLALWVTALLAGASLPARAAETPVSPSLAAAPADSDTWQFSGGPYLWGAGIRGYVGNHSTGTAFMKTDFNDIVSNLDVAVMAMGEARKGPVSLLVDLMYIETTTRNDLPADAGAEHLDIDSKSFTGFMGGSYTVLGDDTARLDVAGGVRAWYSGSTLSLHDGPQGGLSGSDHATWMDALVGLRGQVALSDRVWVSSWGLGGAGQARADWDVAGLVGWDFLPGFSAVAGYRAMGVNYHHNGFVYDIVQQGPLLGISGRF
ncbi:hypothetical protein BFS14_14910 [Serratia fonticola]|uniref:hypothetical protein n=1 Tax=Serratia fonticola TaxID=47917 RepID=UPI0008FD25B3|nr:hypothetical protein [Serratia fonticola]MBC3252317.1 hypothetical protein [Serratia fonticola]OIX95646.1 hypothetical protein BFS14_14910 [Serratia fonticola]QCR62158.1 hypothetical protein FD644_18190 [Serratia fonticola]